MPNVSEEFVKCAQRLAAGTLHTKSAEATSGKEETAQVVKTAAEMAAATLVEQQLIPADQKVEATRQLSDHATALHVLNKTAQARSAAPVATTMGKSASAGQSVADTDWRGEQLTDADRKLFTDLNLM
jgi:hypothetical protein